MEWGRKYYLRLEALLLETADRIVRDERLHIIAAAEGHRALVSRAKIPTSPRLDAQRSGRTFALVIEPPMA
jgi:hypothetical protein